MDDWGDAANFWTDDDRSQVDSEAEVRSPDDSGLGSPLSNTDESRPAWLQEFEAERCKLEDVVGFASEFRTIPRTQPTSQIVKPTDTTSRLIRKRWVLEDNRDVSNFDTILPPEQRAMIHPFELDPFQKRAILHVEKGEHVFVCAHTSAGAFISRHPLREYNVVLSLDSSLRGHVMCLHPPVPTPITLSVVPWKEFCECMYVFDILTPWNPLFYGQEKLWLLSTQ